jgi:hypothetical protein
MWCGSCQQDVPALASAVSGRLVCSQCQRSVGGKREAQGPRICDDGIELSEAMGAAVAAAPPLRGEDWSGRRRVQMLERELRRPAAATTKKASPFPSGPRRFDPPAHLIEQLEAATSPNVLSITPSYAQVATARRQRGAVGQFVTWMVVFAGAIALAMGIGLLAWSLAVKEMTNWNLALGLTLGGQGTMILGLVLVVSRLWRSSRSAAAKLQDVNARLVQLQNTADALTAMRSGGAPAFYAELVRGASPQVLLTNLKGQLDQLATRLASGW